MFLRRCHLPSLTTLVAVDDAAPGGFGEGELLRDGTVNFRRVDRIGGDEC